MALSEVRVASVSSIPLAVVRRQVRPPELALVVPAGCGVVWAFVRAYRLQAGRNVAVYWDDTIRLEVGVELAGSFPHDGEIVPSATPAGMAASVILLGPYQQLGTAHKAIREWCSGHGCELA